MDIDDKTVLLEEDIGMVLFAFQNKNEHLQKFSLLGKFIIRCRIFIYNDLN